MAGIRTEANLTTFTGRKRRLYFSKRTRQTLVANIFHQMVRCESRYNSPVIVLLYRAVMLDLSWMADTHAMQLFAFLHYYPV